MRLALALSEFRMSLIAVRVQFQDSSFVRPPFASCASAMQQSLTSAIGAVAVGHLIATRINGGMAQVAQAAIEEQA